MTALAALLLGPLPAPAAPASRETLDLPSLPDSQPSAAMPAQPAHNPEQASPPAPPTPATGSNLPPVPFPPMDKSLPATVPQAPVASESHTKTTLMFTPDEMAIVAQVLKAYDSYSPTKQEKKQAQEPSISGLLTGLEGQSAVIVQGPSNIYCQEIVYYSRSKWIVRINGGIITSDANTPGNMFYVSKISRQEIELVWKPTQMDQLTDAWNRVTDNGKHPSPGVRIADGKVILHIRPNQTFLVSSASIHEGIIPSPPAPSPAAAQTGSGLIPPIPSNPPPTSSRAP